MFWPKSVANNRGGVKARFGQSLGLSPHALLGRSPLIASGKSVQRFNVHRRRFFKDYVPLLPVGNYSASSASWQFTSVHSPATINLKELR